MRKGRAASMIGQQSPGSNGTSHPRLHIPPVARWIVVCAATVLCEATMANAGPPPAALVSAESQVLFDDGMALMEAKKYEAACAKLEASLKLEPVTATRYYLGECYEHLGRFASAVAMFRDAEVSAKLKGQQDEARQRYERLMPRMIRVVIDAHPHVATTPGVVIQRGGVTLSTAQLGTAVPVDPGEIEITARAPGKKPWSMTLDATKEGATLTVQIPRLEDAPPAEAPAPPPQVAAWPPQRIAGAVATGVGAVSIVVGAALGGVAIDKKNASEKDGLCDANGGCRDLTGVALRTDGRAAGDASTALFVIGGAMLAGGVVLYLTAPKPAEKKPEKATVGAYLGAGTLGITGRW